MSPRPETAGAAPAELRVPADLTGVDRIRSFVRERLSGLGFTEEDAFQVELSIQEICVNIALNAYPEQRGDIRLLVRRDDGRLELEVRDEGVPFDPASAPLPRLEEHVKAGRRGGLGIFLFRTLMDGFRYRREGGENVLTVYKNLP